MPRSEEAAMWYSAVYRAVQQIPHGKVTSYGHIADLLGHRKSPEEHAQLPLPRVREMAKLEMCCSGETTVSLASTASRLLSTPQESFMLRPAQASGHLSEIPPSGGRSARSAVQQRHGAVAASD
nr:hypothetical protein CFP56_16488 [Quercus suber]